MTQEIPQEGKLGGERERKHGFKTIIGFNGAPESNVGLMIPIAQVGDICFQVGTDRPHAIPRGLFDVYLEQGLVTQTSVDLRLDREYAQTDFLVGGFISRELMTDLKKFGLEFIFGEADGFNFIVWPNASVDSLLIGRGLKDNDKYLSWFGWDKVETARLNWWAEIFMADFEKQWTEKASKTREDCKSLEEIAWKALNCAQGRQYELEAYMCLFTSFWETDKDEEKTKEKFESSVRMRFPDFKWEDFNDQLKRYRQRLEKLGARPTPLFPAHPASSAARFIPDASNILRLDEDNEPKLEV